MNAAGRIVNLLEALQKHRNANIKVTYQEALANYFGVNNPHEIIMRLFWLNKELELCIKNVPNNDYANAFSEVQQILNASCLSGEIRRIEPEHLVTFRAMRDFLFTDENKTSPEVLEEITRAIEDLRASITADEEDEPVREALESIAITIEQSVDASIKYGAQPLKDRAEIALGKLMLIWPRIKNEDTKAKAGKLVKAFYTMCEKANTVASFIETITKLLG